MNEAQRMQYLEAMGVDTYVPRFVLPHAKVSNHCELPCADNDSDGVAQEAQPIELVRNLASGFASRPQNEPRKQIDVLGDSNLKESLSRPEPSKDEFTPSEEASAGKEVAFSLALWQLPGLVILNSREQGEALPTDRLLVNILLAAGHPATLPKAEFVNWPLLDRPQQDKSWPAAQEMVLAFLDGKLLTSDVSQMWLFGETAVRCVLGDDIPFESQCFSATKQTDFDCDALIFPALSDVLKGAALKPKIWAALNRFLAADAS